MDEHRLLYNMIKTALSSAVTLGVTLLGSLVFEVAYRRGTGRDFRAVRASTRRSLDPPGA